MLEAPLCHLRRPLDQPCARERKHALHVDARRGQQGLPEAAGRVERRGLGVLEAGGADDRADEGVAVAVQARRRQPDDKVAFGHILHPWKERALLCNADAEADEVEARAGEHPGKLGHARLQKFAAGLEAAVGDTRHELDGLVRIQLLDREVLMEEQRLGAPGGDVVDAKRHDVDSQGAEVADRARDLQLRAEGVGATHQGPTIGGGADLARLAANPHRSGCVLVACPCLAEQRLKTLERGVARCAVNAGGAVCELARLGACHRGGRRNRNLLHRVPGARAAQHARRVG
mmetsp:Transcript_102720/g.296947  ORF Transcript_102720/g.296947 Transcript_102720/m.296947 type:complete len:289 (+) Transcript_102720:1256-2122(+)